MTPLASWLLVAMTLGGAWCARYLAHAAADSATERASRRSWRRFVATVDDARADFGPDYDPADDVAAWCDRPTGRVIPMQRRPR